MRTRTVTGVGVPAVCLLVAAGLTEGCFSGRTFPRGGDASADGAVGECPSGENLCDGVCVDQSDPANCGGCGAQCTSGQCCDGMCTALSVDTRNCGSCGHVCPAAQSCAGGSCDACNCPSGQACCGGSTCLDLRSDPLHCGTCGNACPDGSSCFAGACTPVCGDSELFCGTACAAVLSDPFNCGHCGVVCQPGDSCAAGACVNPPVCPSPSITGIRTDAGVGAPFVATAPFSSATSGGPVPLSATVTVQSQWTPATPNSYFLPVVYWARNPLGPWTGAPGNGVAPSFQGFIPPQADPGEVYFFLSAKCIDDLAIFEADAGPIVTSPATAPSIPGVVYAYAVQ